MPQFPETIAGHPWFQYVDPGIDVACLEQITQAIDTEIQFLLVEVAPSEQQTTEEDKREETHNDDVKKEIGSTKHH